MCASISCDPRRIWLTGCRSLMVPPPVSCLCWILTWIISSTLMGCSNGWRRSAPCLTSSWPRSCRKSGMWTGCTSASDARCCRLFSLLSCFTPYSHFLAAWQVTQLSKHFGLDLLLTPGGSAYSYTHHLGGPLGQAVCIRRELFRFMPPMPVSPIPQDQCRADLVKLVGAVNQTLEPPQAPPTQSA